jgi:predicted CoA-binding protein
MDDAARDTLPRIYRESRTIAVVGASADDQKAAYRGTGLGPLTPAA